MKQNNLNHKKLNSNILLPVIALLIILILASSVLLATVLKGRAADEENVIALFPGDRLSSSAVNVDYVPANIKPGFKAYDDNVSWDTKTDVDLFKKAYYNKNGEQTVKSSNGDKIIAPGTSNSYSFSLKNTGNVDFDYTMSLNSVFKMTDKNLPIEVRLYDGEKWLAGSETSFIPADKLHEIIVKGNLKVSKYVTYTLEWQWPFENTQADMALLEDLNDTILGNTQTITDTNFNLTINTNAEIKEGAVATDADGKPLYDKVSKKANVIYIGTPLAIALGALLALLLILFFRRKVLITGFVPTGYSVKYKKREDIIRADRRFAMDKIKSGTHTFTLCTENGNRIADFVFNIKFRRNQDGVTFKYDDSVNNLIIDKSIRAVELNLSLADGELIADAVQWSAVDKKHNVYYLGNTIPADDNKCNTTPFGLAVDEHNNYTFVMKAKEYENIKK